MTKTNKGMNNTTFAADFTAAFTRLDSGFNYVLLADLRVALPQYDRQSFDNGLNDLRRAWLYSLDAADGRHVRLSKEQIDAGIRESGSMLVYCARR